MTSYSLTTTVCQPYSATIEATREALKAEGFGVITEIDVQQTLKEKLGEEVQPYVILGACNPTFAHQAIATEPEIGLLMPCNVCVWEVAEGKCKVAAVDVEAVFGLVQNPALTAVAAEVGSRLRRVIEALGDS